jgi:1-acyl-sn-glycerol-3-phosphate acyltransferase
VLCNGIRAAGFQSVIRHEELSLSLSNPGDPALHYPRRQTIRAVLRFLIRAALGTLTRLDILGREYLPKGGPLIIVANHFSFIDPLAMIRATPWPLEFLAGARMPNAPAAVTWIPKVWGVFPVYRGSVSRRALRSAEQVLAQNGVMGIFPEGGNWATVLRPARPGAAYLAARCGAPILPIGIDGLTEVFPQLRRGRRAKVTIRIGQPFGPFTASRPGQDRREQLAAIGHRMMERIAMLIPEERRGHYSGDPAVRAAAQGTEIYPWADEPDL